MPNWEDYLNRIWYDTKHPGSFAGPKKLYQVVRKEGKVKIGIRRITQWLQDQDAYSLQKDLITKFKKNRVVVEGIDSLFDGDLADVQNLTSFNDGIKYLLILIDVFSKFLWVVPLKNKLGKTVVNALKSIFIKGRKASTVRFDKGAEFRNAHVRKYLEGESIRVHCTQNSTQANYAERNKTWYKYDGVFNGLPQKHGNANGTEVFG
ncbi:uncharacterized protein LOC117318091 [Pecten maximus]|uniref:uncharacterized protein LOC117318091 n=1 Tax=Pecten maximus TaxID=6579 RepID=UPI00145889EA|nr:uncharacterized protein LOC117318091 [Pecten maximus]